MSALGVHKSTRSRAIAALVLLMLCVRAVVAGGYIPRGGGFISPNGGFVPQAGGYVAEPESSGPKLLLNLEPALTTPAAQSFSTANATHEWLMQETSGDYIDTVGSADWTVSGALQGQTAVGLGSDLISRKASEFIGGTNRLRQASSATMDADASTSIGFRLVFRGVNPGNDSIIDKRASGTLYGYSLVTNTSGHLQFTVNDPIDGVKSRTIAENHMDGAPHYVDCVIDRTLNQLRIRSDLGSLTLSIALTGTLSNATKLSLGDGEFVGAAMENLQISYGAAISGANAETLDSDPDWWTHASVPDLLSAYTRASAMSMPVGAGYLAHYADGQFAHGWDTNFSHASKLGGAFFGVATNLLPDSNDIAGGWTATGATPTANDGDSPDGFRTADSFIATTGHGEVSRIFTTVASTKHTISVWIKHKSGDPDFHLKFWDESGAALLAELADQTATTSWDRYDLTATTNVGQVSSSIRVEAHANGGEFYIDYGQAEEGAFASPNIRTTTGPVTRSAVDASVDNPSSQYLKRSSGTIHVVGAGVPAINTAGDFFFFNASASSAPSNFYGGKRVSNGRPHGVIYDDAGSIVHGNGELVTTVSVPGSDWESAWEYALEWSAAELIEGATSTARVSFKGDTAGTVSADSTDTSTWSESGAPAGDKIQLGATWALTAPMQGLMASFKVYDDHGGVTL